MASFDKHQSQAEHNLELATSLGNGDYRDWTVVSCFYSALHFTNLLFISDPNIKHIDELFDSMRYSTETADDMKRQSIHAFREMIISSKYPEIRTQYRQLRALSEAVRYIENTSDKTGIEYVLPNIADRALTDLGTIKTVVISKLKKDGVLP